MAQVQFIQYSAEELQKQILDGLKVHFDEVLKNFQPQRQSEYLSRNEVAKLFGVNLVTIWNWQRSGILKPLQIGSRIYFLRSDIELALTPLNQ